MIEVDKPNIVKEYNDSMGGVDLFDMFQSLHCMDHKSQKWYMRILYWILSSSVFNGWLQYRKHCEALEITKKQQHTLVQFTLLVSNSFVKTSVPATQAKQAVDRPRLNVSSGSQLDVSLSPTRRRSAPDVFPVNVDVRYDNYEHWPIHREDRPRCFLCKEKCRIGCSKCEKDCLNKDRNCFRQFHKKQL